MRLGTSSLMKSNSNSRLKSESSRSFSATSNCLILLALHVPLIPKGLPLLSRSCHISSLAAADLLSHLRSERTVQKTQCQALAVAAEASHGHARASSRPKCVLDCTNPWMRAAAEVPSHQQGAVVEKKLCHDTRERS